MGCAPSATHAQAAAPAAAQELAPPEGQTGLAYDIEAELDPERHTLSGRERIHFENHSTQPLNALLFHLYLNAFRDTRSVFMREGGAKLRGLRELSHPGSIEITQLRTLDGVDLSARQELELIPEDRTQLRVTLPTPLAPEATLDLALEFRVQLPQLVARSGYAGEFHMLGQWFPKLAKLEPDGSFASFPYHGLGEFYADFADYTVELTVPLHYQVAGAGQLLEERMLVVGSAAARQAAGRGTDRSEAAAIEHHRTADRTDPSERTLRYRAERVLDFAWAAYPYFENHTRTLGPIKLTLYAPRGYGPALTRQADVLSDALQYFQAHYGAYPYPTLTVVIPPEDAEPAAGMEYPTLITSRGPAWALPDDVPDPWHDFVSVHELAHQWFACMIASDEVTYPMLDEGLAEWSALEFLRERYAAPRFWTSRWPLPSGPFDVLRAVSLRMAQGAPSSLLSADGYTVNTLAQAVYVRPALLLSRLGERYGRERVRAAIGRYAQAQRFRHPTPRDLFAAIDATLGEGVGTHVLQQALRSDDDARAQLPAAPAEQTPSPSGLHFLPELLSLALSLLRGIGP